MSNDNIRTSGALEIPEEEMVKYHITDSLIPSYSVIFYNGENKPVGKLDFNGPSMIFEGEAEESAKAFFNWVANVFDKRLEEKTDRIAKQRDVYEKALREIVEYEHGFCTHPEDLKEVARAALEAVKGDVK